MRRFLAKAALLGVVLGTWRVNTLALDSAGQLDSASLSEAGDLICYDHLTDDESPSNIGDEDYLVAGAAPPLTQQLIHSSLLPPPTAPTEYTEEQFAEAEAVCMEIFITSGIYEVSDELLNECMDAWLRENVPEVPRGPEP